MISLKKVKKFCKDYTQINNYEEAKIRWAAKRLEKNTLQDTV